jgi:hypothetical protein
MMIKKFNIFLNELLAIPKIRELKYKTNLPTSEIFYNAVKNTKGAEIVDDGLILCVVRYQPEEQSGENSLRSGVFYLPVDDPNIKYYKGANKNYGGISKFEGNILLKNPIFIKGATGGKAPENAYNQICGNGQFDKMRSDVLKIISSNKNIIVENITELLTKYNNTDYDDNYDLVYNIVSYSKKGNTLAYAIQENIIK